MLDEDHRDVETESHIATASAPRIEHIIEAVAEQVEADHDRHDGEARPHRHPWRLAKELARHVEHAAPGGRGRQLAEPEEGEARLGEDRDRRRERRLDDDPSEGWMSSPLYGHQKSVATTAAKATDASSDPRRKL